MTLPPTLKGLQANVISLFMLMSSCDLFVLFQFSDNLDPIDDKQAYSMIKRN